jgi:MFS family permease
VATSEVATPAPEGPSLWRNGDFLRLWYGQVVSTVGSGLSRLALPLLVLALTGSPAQAGLIGAAQSVPFILLGLPAGALLDRWNRKTVMVVCDAARLLAFGSVPLAWALGVLTTAHLYAVAFIHGTALVFFSIAQLAALPRVVPTRQLARAHSLNTATEGVASLVSPGIAGTVIGLASTVAAGASLAYLLDSVTYLVSVISLATIRAPFQTNREAAPLRQIHLQIAEGIRYIWTRVPLRGLWVVNMLHRMCFAPVQLSVVVLATQHFHADARTVGLLFSAAGTGALTSSVFTPWLRARVSVGHSMNGLTACHAIGLAVVALAPSVPAAAAGMFVAGAMENMTGIVQVTYRLAVIPDALQGRVNSSYRFASFTAVAAGTAAGGLLLERLGPQPVLLLLAGCIALIALGIAVSPIRRI